MVLRDCDGPSDTIDWIEAFGSTHPVLCDRDLAVWDEYGIGLGKPQYIVMDQEMNIAYRGMGPADHTTAEARVLDLLGS